MELPQRREVVIKKRTGPVSFLIKLTDGRYQRCHQDQLRRRCVVVDTSSDPGSSIVIDIQVPSPAIQNSDPEPEVPV